MLQLAHAMTEKRCSATTHLVILLEPHDGLPGNERPGFGQKAKEYV